MVGANRSVRIAIPIELAVELLAEGAVEEAVPVRNVAEIVSIAIDTINTAGAVVALASGAGSVYKFAKALVMRAKGEGVGSGEITLTKQHRTVTIKLSDDVDRAVDQVIEMIDDEILDDKT